MLQMLENRALFQKMLLLLFQELIVAPIFDIFMAGKSRRPHQRNRCLNVTVKEGQVIVSIRH